MGLDIRITRRKAIICPHCGKVVGYDIVGDCDSGGRAWYPFLESIGYYVSYEERTEENDWYGKDKVLTEEQALELHKFVTEHELYNTYELPAMIATAILADDQIVVNADW